MTIAAATIFEVRHDGGSDGPGFVDYDAEIARKRDELAQLEAFCDNAKLEVERIHEAAQRQIDRLIDAATAEREAAAKDRKAAARDRAAMHVMAVRQQRLGFAAAVAAERAASREMTVVYCPTAFVSSRDRLLSSAHTLRSEWKH